MKTTAKLTNEVYYAHCPQCDELSVMVRFEETAVCPGCGEGLELEKE